MCGRSAGARHVAPRGACAARSALQGTKICWRTHPAGPGPPREQNSVAELGYGREPAAADGRAQHEPATTLRLGGGGGTRSFVHPAWGAWARGGAGAG